MLRCSATTAGSSMTATAIFSWTIVLKVKGVVEVKCRVVLCAYGITHAGVRELIDFRQAASESEAMWTALLDSLYRRGLSTDRLEMVGTDGGVGLHRALDTVYPFVPRQRCWAYKMRNVAAKLPRKHQDVCMAQAKDHPPGPHPPRGCPALPPEGCPLAEHRSQRRTVHR